MKYELDRSEFVNLFDQYNRGDNFTVAARDALFDYYESLEDDTGTEFTVDIIAICCDWSEYTIEEALADYDHLFDADDLQEAKDEDNLEEFVKDQLEYHTTILEVEHYDAANTYLVQVF